MIRMRARTVIVALLPIAISTGCGGSTPAASSGDPTPAATAQRASSGSRKNACDLLDREKLEAIAGRKLSMMHDIQADDQTACELRDPADHSVLVTVTVHWAGGKELARTNLAAMSMARQLLNDDDVDLEEVTGSKRVRGLADKAFYSDVMPSWILKKDVLIEMISPRFTPTQTKAVFLAVSRGALPKL
jgi:hypothetical protein